MVSISASDSQPREELSETKQEIAEGGGLAFAGKASAKVIRFGLNLILGRFLGPAGYGLWALGSSTVSVLEPISKLGLDKGTVRDISGHLGQENDEDARDTAVSVLVLSLLSGAALGGVLLLAAKSLARSVFGDPALVGILRVFAVSLPFLSVFGVLTAILRGKRRIDLDVVVGRILNPVLLLVGVAGGLFLGYGVIGAVWGFTLASMTSVGLGLLVVYRAFPQFFTGRFRFGYASSVLRVSLPTLAMGIAYLLLTHTDRLMLGYFSSSSDVGIYNAATILSLQLPIFLAALGSIFAPVIAERYKRGRDVDAIFETTSRWVFSLTLPFFLLVVVFPETLLSLFGAGFGAAALALQILAVAQMVNVSTGMVGSFLQMTGKHDLELVNGIALVILNIGLNLVLIPRLGLTGAAVATGTSLAAIHLIRLLELHSIENLSPFGPPHLKPTVAGALTLISLAAFQLLVPEPTFVHFLLGGLLGGVIYVLVLVLQGLTEDDRRALVAVQRKVRGWAAPSSE